MHACPSILVRHALLLGLGLLSGLGGAIAGAPGDNWGFELGGLDGWTKTGTAFDQQPTYGDNVQVRSPGAALGHVGKYWVGTYEGRPNDTVAIGTVQGDEPQGTLTSPAFSVGTRYIRFLVGGGSDVKSTRVELILADSKEETTAVRTAAGVNDETLRPVEWDVSEFGGRTARIRIVDSSGGPWGHISCDDFQFADRSISDDPPPKNLPPRKEGLDNTEFQQALAASGLTDAQVKESQGKRIPLVITTAKGAAAPRAYFADGSSVGLIPADALDGNAKLSEILASSAEQVPERASLPEVKRSDLPAVFDNIDFQTTYRNQGERGTCCVFGPIAAMEAVYKRTGYGDLDLSEQYGNWLKNVTKLPASAEHDLYAREHAESWETVPGSFSAGLGCVGVTQLLKQYRTCDEVQMPYVESGSYENVAVWPSYARFGLQTFMWNVNTTPQHPINLWNFEPEQMNLAVREGLRYGVKRSTVLAGDEFRDTGFLEALVVSGRDVIFSMNLVGQTSAFNPRDPVWRRLPGAPPGGGHCMLIVGYDREREFFIVKDSYGSHARDPASFDARWNDLMAPRYHGHVFIDYAYLTSAISEACFISEVEIPAAQFPQRLLGLWDVSIRRLSTGAQVSQGVLAWRRMPLRTSVGSDEPTQTRRIGDFHDDAHGDFRVNGEMPVMPPSRQNVTLYVNFDHPATTWSEASGSRVVCELENISNLRVRPAFLRGRFLPPTTGTGGRTVFGVPIGDLELTATLRN